MKSRIPEDFGTAFPMSDIVLDTFNAKGKELHASKMILATYSPYYEAMFCGAEWTEKTAKSLVIEEDYNVVLEALRIIYSIHTIDQTPHPPAMLGELYRFSDKYDFPMIREMCEQELEAQVTCESLLVTAQLGLHDIKSKLFAKMDPDSIRKFVDSVDDGNEVLFTMNDLRLVEKKLADGAAKDYKELKLVSVCDECHGKTLCNRDCVYCNPKISPIAKLFYIISNALRPHRKQPLGYKI